MAIKLKVRKKKQIVVPIRFVRAITGSLVVGSPEVDDRGFSMGTRPGTWGATDTRGAMVSVAEGDTISIRVLPVDIDAGAPLFVTSSNTDIVTITGSAGPLGIDGIFQITGIKDLRDVPVKIQVHLGAIDGPVLGELEPHIFQMRELRVRAHLVTINGVSTTHTPEDLVPFFNDVNVFWRSAGIKFLYNPDETRKGSINGFKVAGQVTRGKSNEADEKDESSRVMNLVDKVTGDKPDRNAINIYFVRFANAFSAVTLDHDAPRPIGFGIIVADKFTGFNDPLVPNITEPVSLAHELGHYLNSPDHAGEFVDGKQVNDIFSERRIMFTFTNIDSKSPYRLDVGYGFRLPGALISVKDISADRTDGEIARNRFRALNPN